MLKSVDALVYYDCWNNALCNLQQHVQSLVHAQALKHIQYKIQDVVWTELRSKTELEVRATQFK